MRSSGQQGRDDQQQAPVIGWLQSPWTFVLLCLAAALPLAFLDTMPLVDLGGHLGRYAIQLDNGASPALRQWYSFQWALLPNLGVDLLVQALAPVIGLEPAVKLIVVCIPLLQVAGWLLIARAAHGHIPPTALFALPLAYSVTFHFGFVNFALCSALASLALALWIELGNRQQMALRWLLFVPISCVLWVCHLAGWAMFCIFAGADELVRRRAQFRDLKRTFIQSALSLSALVLPQLASFLWHSSNGNHGLNADFFHFLRKLAWFAITLRDRWQAWDRLATALLFVLIFVFWRNPRFRCHKGLALGAILMLGCFVLVPTMVMGSDYADMRLIPMMLAIALIAARPDILCSRRTLSYVAAAGLAFVGARFVGNDISMELRDRQFTQTLSVLPAVPRDAQLVTFSMDRCEEDVRWNADRRKHLAGYAIARRHAFANDQWDLPGAQLLTVHNPAAGQFAKQPSQDGFEMPCPGKLSIFQKVPLIPSVTRYMWMYGGTRRFSFAGWHPIRAAGDSVVYQRD